MGNVRRVSDRRFIDIYQPLKSQLSSTMICMAFFRGQTMLSSLKSCVIFTFLAMISPARAKGWGHLPSGCAPLQGILDYLEYDLYVPGRPELIKSLLTQKMASRTSRGACSLKPPNRARGLHGTRPVLASKVPGSCPDAVSQRLDSSECQSATSQSEL